MYKYLKFDSNNWLCWICSDGNRFSTYTRADEHEAKLRENQGE